MKGLMMNYPLTTRWQAFWRGTDRIPITRLCEVPDTHQLCCYQWST